MKRLVIILAVLIVIACQYDLYDRDVEITLKSGSKESYTNVNLSIIGTDFDFDIREPLIKIQITKKSKVYIKISTIEELHITPPKGVK